MSEIQKKLGDLLRVERERQNTSLDEMSARLKISESNLTSIEEGRASDFPSELYFNLFTRSYCQSLGIDHARTLEAIQVEIEDQTRSESPPKSDKGEKVKRGESAGDDAESEEIEPVANIKRLGMIFGGIIVLFVGFMLIYKFVFDSSGQEAASAGDETKSGEAAESKEAELQLAGYQWGTVRTDHPEPIRLRLTAIDSSWATILADGDTAIFRKLRPGRIYNVEAKYRLRISVGIPRAVVIELNDKEIDIVDPETRRISRVRINQMNLDSFLNSAPPVTGGNEPKVGSIGQPVGGAEQIGSSEIELK